MTDATPRVQTPGHIPRRPYRHNTALAVTTKVDGGVDLDPDVDADGVLPVRIRDEWLRRAGVHNSMAASREQCRRKGRAPRGSSPG